MTFAEEFRQLGDAPALTQEQMEERSGINLWTIRDYEQGRCEPNWKGLLSLAKALNVAAEVFSERDESATEEESARPRGRPSRPVTPAGVASNRSEPTEICRVSGPAGATVRAVEGRGR